VQYSYDDHSIVVVNAYYKSFPGLKVTATVYNLDMSQKFSKSKVIDIGPDSSTRVFKLPAISGLSKTYFVDLRLGNSGALASANFYWLSTAPETLDWARRNEISGDYHISTWTPIKTYADYTALNTLPQVDLEVTAQSKRSAQQSSTTVTVHNPSHTLAFDIWLKVVRPAPQHARPGRTRDNEILPVLWQDNYFSLLPGETRKITATYNTKDLPEPKPDVAVEGWNIKREVLESN
ncbi:MAG: glycoside hydrolase family 2 protein, partial [Terriglobia bacterium]